MKRPDLSSSEIESRLSAAGLRPTAQRIAVARYVLCEADHPAAEDVKAWLDRNFPKASLATVYNSLKALVKARLLREVRLPHDERLRYDHNTGAHHHFIDERSGRVYDLPAEAVAVRLALGRGFKAGSVEVVVRGSAG